MPRKKKKKSFEKKKPSENKKRNGFVAGAPKGKPKAKAEVFSKRRSASETFFQKVKPIPADPPTTVSVELMAYMRNAVFGESPANKVYISKEMLAFLYNEYSLFNKLFYFLRSYNPTNELAGDKLNLLLYDFFLFLADIKKANNSAQASLIKPLTDSHINHILNRLADELYDIIFKLNKEISCDRDGGYSVCEKMSKKLSELFKEDPEAHDSRIVEYRLKKIQSEKYMRRLEYICHVVEVFPTIGRIEKAKLDLIDDFHYGEDDDSEESYEPY